MSTNNSFDWHVGAVVDGLAIPHGGRQFLKDLLPWSKNTLARRLKGESGFTVRELHAIAPSLNTTAEKIVSQALRNFSGTTTEDGLAKLRNEAAQEARPQHEQLDDVSQAPASMEERRKAKAKLTEEQARKGKHAANYDPEHTEDDDLRDD